MRALLDTHTFLWWNQKSPKLSETAIAFIADERNEILLSAAVGWEIAIKYGKGRLDLPIPPESYVAERMKQHRFSPLPILMSHSLEVYKLPMIHQDPFDRMLIVQSLLEKVPILTVDTDILNYDVETIW